MEIKYISTQLKVLLAVSIGLFVLIAGVSMLAGPSGFEESYFELLDEFGTLSGLLVIGGGEFWRLISSMFLHVDIIHLAFNMFALYRLGMIVDKFYGKKVLVITYVIAGLVGGIFSILFMDPRIGSVGASGAIFGLLGLIIAGSYRPNHLGQELPFQPIDVMPIAIYSFMFGLIPNSGINNFAHGGGFLAGLLLGYVFSMQRTTNRRKAQKYLEDWLYWGVIIVSVIGLLLMLLNILSSLSL